MFFSSNRAQKSFSAEEGKEAAQDWDSPKVGTGNNLFFANWNVVIYQMAFLS
jgi:hypothetical protein